MLSATGYILYYMSSVKYIYSILIESIDTKLADFLLFNFGDQKFVQLGPIT